MSATPETRDSILVEFSDSESSALPPDRPASDETIRYGLRRYPLGGRCADRYDLPRLEQLAAEEIDAIRAGGGNLLELACCLSSLAWIHRSRGDFDRALARYAEAETIWRDIGARDDLTRTQLSRAAILADDKGDPKAALPLAEEAHDLARRHGLTWLDNETTSLWDRIRRALADG